MKNRVIVTETEYCKAEKIFASAPDFNCQPAPGAEAELALAIRQNQVRAVIVGVEKYQDALYQALPRGGVIIRFGVGHDSLDKDALRSHALYCANTPGVLDASVAEHTIALMLSAARHIPAATAATKTGKWPPFTGSEFEGKTLAVIGCGAIGTRVAAIARNGFGMRVFGYDCIEKKLPDAFEFCSRDWARVVKDADYVTLHIPVLQETRNLINAETLSAFKSSAWLINTARGALVDENALGLALQNGQLAGAALDVTSREPYQPDEFDLRTFENVIMTPHIASSTTAACNRMALACLENLRQYFAGNPDGMSLVC